MKLLGLKLDADTRRLLDSNRWWVDGSGYITLIFNGKRTRLHRLIMGNPPGKKVDHRNRHKLDCRRRNLRITDNFGNARNSRFRSHNTSGFRGVHLCNCTGRWRAEIRVNSRGLKLGRFDSKEEAAQVYDAAARIHHGEFAVLNFPRRGESAARDA